MSQPNACLRCKGIDLADASIDATAGMRVVVGEDRATGISARVCLTCGAIMLTATEVSKLQARGAAERIVQEYDF